MTIHTMTEFAQPYSGSNADMEDFLVPKRTTAQLASATDSVNTVDKYVGKMAFNTTLGKPVYASAAAAAAAWRVAEGVQILATEAGAAGIIAGTGTVYRSSIRREGGLITTEIFIDLTGLNSNAAADIIGVNAAVDCHLGQITVAENGTLVYGSMKCQEAPATGIDDIDLFSAVESNGAEDAPITGLDETSLLAAGSAWTLGEEQPLTTLPVANEFLYLVGSGAGADATYTAGRFVIRLLGYDA